VQAHLSQISQLLGPGAAAGLAAAPALQPSPARAVAGAPANGGGGSSSRSHPAKTDQKSGAKAGDGDEEWWTE